MSTVQIKYSPLLTLSVRQLFYINQICSAYQSDPVLDFAIVPTDECQAYMKAKNIVFKNTDATGGFIVLARTLGTNGAGNDVLRGTIAAADKLTFLMMLKNPNLVNFDALPVQLALGNVYYFSNQVTDAAAVRNNLDLTKDAAGADGSNDQIKKTTNNYTHHYAGVVTAGDVKVTHLLTSAVIGPKMVNTHGGASDLYFDLSTLPSGCCQLFVSGALTDTFYFLGTMADQGIFGVIELSLSASLAANYRIVEADMSLVPARPNYTVLFKNRQTTWRYTIQLQPNSPLYLEMSALTPAQKIAFINQLCVSANDTSITFKLSANTDTGFVFTSQSNISLQEQYLSSTSATPVPLIISLSKYITTPAKEAVVKSNLPYPSTNIIDSTNSPVIYSDVLITI